MDLELLMCLAVPGKILECAGDDAVVDLQGNRLRVSRVLTPDAGPGDWVLIHAGFAITQLDEAEARQTWDYLQQALGTELDPHLEAHSSVTPSSPLPPDSTA